MKATRVFQIAALLIVIVAVVQVGWWVLDQHNYTVQKVRSERALYTQQVGAAEEMLRAGVAPDRVARLLPDLTLQGAGADQAGRRAGAAGTETSNVRVAVSPAINDALASERDRRLNQYAW